MKEKINMNYKLSSNNLVTFANFFPLDLILVVVILDMEECVSAIILQLIVLPFSLDVILVSPYVHTSTPPRLPLSIESLLFVYLS